MELNSSQQYIIFLFKIMSWNYNRSFSLIIAQNYRHFARFAFLVFDYVFACLRLRISFLFLCTYLYIYSYFFDNCAANESIFLYLYFIQFWHRPDLLDFRLQIFIILFYRIFIIFILPIFYIAKAEKYASKKML